MDVVAEILGLLRQAEPLTPEQQTQLGGLYSQLSDEQLVEVETGLMGLFDEVRAEDITAESVAHLTRIADVVDGVRVMAGQRITEAEEVAAQAAAEEAERQTQLDALLSRVHASDPDPGGDGDPDEPDDPADPDAAEVVAEAEQIVEEAAEPVTAAAPPTAAPAPASRPATTPRGQIAARTPQARRAQPRTPAVSIRATGGGTLNTRVDVEDALIRRWRDLERARGPQAAGDHCVATFERHFAPEQTLRDGRVTDVTEIAHEIAARIHEPGGADALVADGGICGPVEHIYDAPQIFQASRPLRAALTQRNTPRGGISWTPAVTLGDILTAETPTSGRAIGVITEAQDAAATYDKSVQRITCGTETEVRVEAVYKQLEFGNFIARSNPERASQFTDASEAVFARFNEQRLFNKMLALTTEVNAIQKLGATRDLLTALNRAAINYRARHRMPIEATLDVVLPAWVGMGLLPDDQTNALQSYPEQFEVTSSWVETRLRQRGINVLNWFQDDFTTALVAGGGDNNYPGSFKVIMAHPGAFVYLDQGTLDFGVVRDSTLIVNNLFRTFMEEFYNVAMWGVEAMSIDFSLCENGASAGSRTPTCGS